MVQGMSEACNQLQEPLLPERSGSFSFQPEPSPPEHAVNVKIDNADSISASPASSVKSRSGSRRFSGFDSLRSGDWRVNSSSRARFEDGGGGGGGGGGDGEHGEREKAKKRGLQSKRSLRNPIERKSFVKRAAHSATHDPVSFVKNLIWGTVLWPKWAWDAMQAQKALTVLSLKAGVAAGLASIVCVLNLPAPYSGLSTISIWAVVTIDILSEGNVGLSLSKGVNRVAGTFSAGALAVMLTQLGPDVPESVYPYYVVFWVTFGGFVFRFLKGIPPLKDQWGYAFTVATIAFHILLISDYQQPERVTLPLLRFLMIMLGFVLASIVNLAFQPIFAGDTLHKLVAKNFDTAADVLARCVTEYSNSKMLDHVPDILSGRSVDDKIHQSYHEIVMSDSDVDKLLNAVTWEPCHGPFFIGYPWHLYDDITDYLRYTLYDVIALDSCLRASIQAPKHLRDIFSQEMDLIAEECSNVLHTLADCMRNMQKFCPEDILQQAEEGALALQNKIYIHTDQLLGRGALDSPRYPIYLASSHVNQDQWSEVARAHQNYSDGNHTEILPGDSSVQSDQFYGDEKDSSKSPGKDVRFSSVENGNRQDNTIWRDHSSPVPIPHQRIFNEESDGTSKTVGKSNGGGVGISTEQTLNSSSPGQTGSGLPGSPPRSKQNNDSVEIVYDGIPEMMEAKSCPSADDILLEQSEVYKRLQQIEDNITVVGKVKGASGPAWKESFMQRKSSLGHNWEGSLERISALSLVKFASLLIEVVAKMKFVVNSVDDLSQAAKFKEICTDQHEDF